MVFIPRNTVFYSCRSDLKKKADRSPLFIQSRSAYFFISDSFLQSAFILSSALAGSILAHFSVNSALSLSDIAPPWEPAKALTEAIAKAAITSVDSNLFIFNILKLIGENTAE
jgi:hypothetical protein